VKCHCRGEERSESFSQKSSVLGGPEKEVSIEGERKDEKVTLTGEMWWMAMADLSR
jgi:hypothetical protein